MLVRDARAHYLFFFVFQSPETFLEQAHRTYFSIQTFHSMKKIEFRVRYKYWLNQLTVILDMIMCWLGNEAGIQLSGLKFTVGKD